MVRLARAASGSWSFRAMATTSRTASPKSATVSDAAKTWANAHLSKERTELGGAIVGGDRSLAQSSRGGLPLRAIPGSKLGSGPAQPAFGLAEAERRADRMLAARSLLGPAADIAARNAA